jgi:isopentenyl-diphosphate delta-isomerase type 1
MEEMFDVLDENGNFTNQVIEREICHKEGLWHRAVVVFIINSDNQVLLQKRSTNKKLWPNLWDLTAGGHVLTGEFGFEAAIRETKEEIGLDIDKKDLLFIGGAKSTNIKGDIINNHFNEYFIVNKDIDIDELTLQEEEVQAIKWFNSAELIKKIHNNYEDLTDKVGCWQYLERYLEHINKSA